MRPIKWRIGEKHGMLTVVNYLGMHVVGGRRRTKWRCKCECGGTLETTGDQLADGNTNSCGCLRTKLARIQAGYANAAYSRQAKVRAEKRLAMIEAMQ